MNKNNFKSIISSINSEISKLDNIKTETLDKYIKNLKKKISELEETGEKLIIDNDILKIGIVGQVKAGKSTFLNSLIFDGEDVLPKASTPMTAGLTILKYSDKNFFEVEYYNSKEWEVFKDGATQYDNRVYQEKCDNPELSESEILLKIKSESGNEEMVAFKELVSSCSNVALQNIKTNSKIESKEFSNIKDLQDILENYVGSTGKFTSVVKSLTIYLNDKRLKGVQIVDTPGVNDPIISREQKTKSFLKECHGVFFLSWSARFFDNTDASFLVDRIGNEGIGTVVLLASKFDSVLQDAGMKFHDDLLNAIEDCQRKLEQQYRINISTANFDGDDPVLDFSSGIGYSIWKKEKYKRNAIEKNVVAQMQRFYPSFFSNEEEIKEMFKNLSQIDTIQEQYLYGVFIKNKEKILNDKITNYFSSANKDIVSLIDTNINRIQEESKILDSESIESLRKKKVNSQKILDEIIDTINRISNNLHVELNKNLKETLNKFYIKATVKKEYKSFYGTRKSTFLGREKTFSVSVEVPNVGKMIDEAVAELRRFLNTAVPDWERKGTLINEKISNKVREMLDKSKMNDVEGNLDTGIMMNILDDVISSMKNASVIRVDDILSEFESNLSLNLIGVDRISLHYDYKISEGEAQSYVRGQSIKAFEKAQSIISSEISAIRNEIEKLLGSSSNDIIEAYSQNRNELKKLLKEGIEKNISNLEKDLKEKEKSLEMYKKSISIFRTIKEKCNETK